jgi:hypothetical protein
VVAASGEGGGEEEREETETHRLISIVAFRVFSKKFIWVGVAGVLLGVLRRFGCFVMVFGW